MTASSTTYVIVVDGIDVGRARLITTPDHLEIAGLQVLPQYQNRGVGTAIVRSVLEEGLRCAIRVVLEVETDNPDAQRLYERLGFVPGAIINGVRRTMTCQPGAAGSQ